MKDKRNLTYDDPNEQLEILQTKVLINNNFTNSHQISVGEKLTFEHFITLSESFLQNGKHLWFSIGNLTGNFIQSH